MSRKIKTDDLTTTKVVKFPKGIGIEGNMIFVDPDHVYPVILSAMGFEVDKKKQAGGRTREEVLFMKRILRLFLLEKIGLTDFTFLKDDRWRTKMTEGKREEIFRTIKEGKASIDTVNILADQLKSNSLVTPGKPFEPEDHRHFINISRIALNQWWNEAQEG